MRKQIKVALESDTGVAATAEAAAAETGAPEAAAAATMAAADTPASDVKAVGEGALLTEDEVRARADAVRIAADAAEHTPAGDHTAESPLSIGNEIHPDLAEDDVAESEMEDTLEIAAADGDASLVESNDSAAALESLQNTVAQVRTLIASRECTPATLALATESIRSQLARTGYELPALSLEAETGIEEAHRQLSLATESVMGRIGQDIVMQHKHQWNAVADFFRTIDGQIGKYDGKLNSAKQEFDGLHGKLGAGPFKVSLGGLWYHFATDKGQATNLIAQVEADLHVSKYLLVDYPTQVLALLKHQMSLLSNLKNLHDPQQLETMAKEIAGGKHPFELFDHSMLNQGGFPLLSVVGLRIREGSKPKALGPGEVYEKLASAEQLRYVYEQGSVKHFGKKVLANATTITKALDIAGNKDVTFSAADIAKLIELSKQYLAYAEEYRKIYRAADSMYENLWNLSAQDLTDAGDGYVYARSESRLLTALYETVWNSFVCVWHPALSETRRAVKAAKYGHYLALRMMHHAEHGD